MFRINWRCKICKPADQASPCAYFELGEVYSAYPHICERRSNSWYIIQGSFFSWMQNHNNIEAREMANCIMYSPLCWVFKKFDTFVAPTQSFKGEIILHKETSAACARYVYTRTHLCLSLRRVVYVLSDYTYNFAKKRSFLFVNYTASFAIKQLNIYWKVFMFDKSGVDKT